MGTQFGYFCKTPLIQFLGRNPRLKPLPRGFFIENKKKERYITYQMDENTLVISGIKIFYHNRGAGDAILILHGWGSRSEHWLKTQEELVRRGYRVIIPDLPGFGRSDEPPDEWSLAEYSQFINEFSKAVYIPYFTLVGHSFGGRIAMDYAIRHPKQVHALVLIDAAGITPRKKLKLNFFMVLSKVGNLIFELPLLEFLQPIVRKVWYKITRINDYYVATSRMRAVMRRVMEENLEQYLPHITKPTLILWGENDFTTPISDALIIHRSIPVTHLHIFPGAGHSLELEVPLKIARQMDKFLKTI